ncbi:MAG: DUF494 domain-containing protein [Sinobacteraceae bacterium]|nr:DUF494 domain-containing protein [Nevskiaceae bacterium]
MKETLLDVLLFLFENYEDAETYPAANRDTLRSELTAAGFPTEQVEHAFAWLARLADPLSAGGTPASLHRTRISLRVYAPSELEALDAECRGLLLELERLDLIDVDARERVIDLLMALDIPIDTRLVKWACVLVMLNREGPAEMPEEDELAGITLELQALSEGRERLQ